MVRLCLLVLASVSILLTSQRSAEPCGAKIAVRSGQSRLARRALEKRRATLVAMRRTPIRTGPTVARERVGAGPDRAATGGGAATTTAANAPKKQRKPRRVAQAPVEKAPELPAREEETAAATTTEPDTSAETSSVPRTEPGKVVDPDIGRAKPRKTGKFGPRVFFKGGSSEITDEARAILDHDVNWLTANPDATITVNGHASRVGSAGVNQLLSEARAEAVKSYLVEQGVEASRIETHAYGMKKPEFKPPRNPKNRRVVIRVNK